MNTYRKDVRLAQRWFPLGAMAINHPEGLGVVYVSYFDSPKLAGQVQVVAYRGTSGKSEFNYRMLSRDAAEKKVAEWFTSLLAHKVATMQRREANNAPHSLKIGDIITNSWGYDQTNVDCYQITRTTAHFVWLKPIASETVNSEGHAPMSGHVVPRANAFLDKPEEQHKASGQYVTFEFGSGSKWDGRSLYCSWYA